MNSKGRRKQRRGHAEDAGADGYVSKREALAELETLRAERDDLRMRYAALQERAGGLVAAARQIQAENAALRAERVHLVADGVFGDQVTTEIGTFPLRRVDLGALRLALVRTLPGDGALLEHIATAARAATQFEGDDRLLVIGTTEPIEGAVGVLRVVPVAGAREDNAAGAREDDSAQVEADHLPAETDPLPAEESA
jgi:hypothetical protein